MGVDKWRLRAAVRKYPDLNCVVEDSRLVVKGSIKIVDDVSYDVHITFPEEYPYAFPIVREVSNKIPKDADRHVYTDGSLCLAVKPQEVILCKRGLSFETFIEKVLTPHLAREYVRDVTGAYPQGEYSHGSAGILEYFQERAGITEPNKILQLIEIALDGTIVGMYDPCICGSERKFKFCHHQVCLEFREMGKVHLKGFRDAIANIKR
jgi:hypothetical protein